jgi:hypothetical protein
MEFVPAPMAEETVIASGTGSDSQSLCTDRSPKGGAEDCPEEKSMTNNV